MVTSETYAQLEREFARLEREHVELHQLHMAIDREAERDRNPRRHSRQIAALRARLARHLEALATLRAALREWRSRTVSRSTAGMT